jgi:hypothetical protein
MLNKIASFALILVLTTISFQTAFAKSSNDWNSVVGLINNEIAVKETGGQTTFGILRSANDNAIVIEVAEKGTLSGQMKTILRSEARKVWHAELRFGERSTGKGAATGAGVGAGIGLIVLISSAKSDMPDGQAGVAVPVYAILGAGIGAVAGFFSKKGHKKKGLIYEKQ